MLKSEVTEGDFCICDILESVVVFIKLRFPGPFFPPHNERIDWKPREGEVGTLFGLWRVRDGVWVILANTATLCGCSMTDMVEPIETSDASES